MIKKSSNGKIGTITCNKKTVPHYKRIKPLEKDITTGQILNDSLHDIFVEDGVENVYDKIQSHKRECDIYEILRTCEATGTLAPLGDPEAENYTDITGIPNSIAETLEKLPTQSEIDELTQRVKELQDALKTKPVEEVKETETNE